MTNKSIIVVITWWFVCGFLSSQTPECENSWFGSSCRYKCHCTNNNCDDNGSCTSGATCVDGWFGPACQYVNLASDGSSSVPGLTTYSTTCNPSFNLDIVTLSFHTSIPFTWMRVEFNESASFQKFNLQFHPKGRKAVIDCKNLRNATVTNTSMDIHCDLDVAVDQVILKGEGVKSLCSIYISGGRNLALKQQTSQSSSLKPDSSYKAVDGRIRNGFVIGSCSQTRDKDSKPTWNLIFSNPHFINRYVLYNRNGFKPERLQGFVVESFSPDGSRVFRYRDREKKAQTIYRITSVGVTAPISRVKIRAAFKDLRNRTILSLCEVEVYGETVCPEGKYGLECQMPCNCEKKDETCFVSTGGCPSGCSSGFYGEDCQKGCPINKYGVNCSQECSEHCSKNLTEKMSVCHHLTGNCLHGCVDGYGGDECTTIYNAQTAEESDEIDLGQKIGIGVACGLTVIAILLFIILVYWVQKVKKAKKDRDKKMDVYNSIDETQPQSPSRVGTYKRVDGYDLPQNVHLTRHYLNIEQPENILAQNNYETFDDENYYACISDVPKSNEITNIKLIEREITHNENVYQNDVEMDDDDDDKKDETYVNTKM